MSKIKIINKKIRNIFFTFLAIITIVVTPTIVMGVKYNQKRHPDRVPFDLYTPLPSSWYLAGDINVIDDEIFNKQYKSYKNNIKDEDLPISFAKLTMSNLNSIKEYYEKPLLDLTFDLKYNEDPSKIIVNLPKQLKDIINNNELDDYNSHVSTVLSSIKKDSLQSFAYQVINYIYLEIQKNKIKYKDSKKDLAEINSYLYTLDKEIDNSNEAHKVYRLQMWASSLNDITLHSDNKNLKLIEGRLENVYNYTPLNSPILNRGATVASNPKDNLFSSGTIHELFCYSEANHNLPNTLVLNDDKGTEITDRNIKEKLYHKILKYLCIPITKERKLILKERLPSSDKTILINTGDFDLHWKLEEYNFKNLKNVALDLINRGLAWFDLPTGGITDTTVEINLKLKEEIISNLEHLHANYNNPDKPDLDWWFTWQQGVGADGKLFGWWVVYDLVIDGNDKSFIGHYFQGFLDNTFVPGETKVIECKDDKNNSISFGFSWLCNRQKANNEFNYNWNDGNKRHLFFTPSFTSSLERKYETFQTKEKTDPIIASIKNLIKIGDKFLNHPYFKKLSFMANKAIGGEILDILRSIGGYAGNNDSQDYWSKSVEQLRLYINKDSGLNWYSLISNEDLSESKINTISNVSDYINQLPLISFFKFFTEGTEKESNKRIENYLVDGMINYSGFIPNGHFKWNFLGVDDDEATWQPVNAKDPNVWNTDMQLYLNMDDSFNYSSVNAGVMTLIIKYISLISYNYKILENKPSLTVDDKINNLKHMLWNNYKTSDHTSTSDLAPYFHTSTGGKKSGNLTIQEINSQFSTKTFELWLESLLGHNVVNYK